MTHSDHDVPDDFFDNLESIVIRVVEEIRKCLDTRLAKWKIDVAEREVHEVIGALLARQVTLAQELIESPRIWNEHLAPVVLRCMADVYISLAWILLDPLDRSRRFILYGLGQEKLLLEHRQEQLRKDGKDPTEDPAVQVQEQWINSQQFTFLTEVNVGSWSGIDTRKMAEEANCLDFYRYVYSPFSPAVHSTWNHICKYNTKECLNPLHLAHRLAVLWEIPCSLDYLLLAVKYVEKALRLFDKHVPLSVDEAMLLEFTYAVLGETAKKGSDSTKTVDGASPSDGNPPSDE